MDKWTYILLCIMALIILMIIHIKVNDKDEETKELLDINYKDMMEILDATIMREFLYKRKFEYELKNIKALDSFEKHLIYLVTKTRESFSETFWNSLTRYYSEDYIIKYITKSHEMLLMDYIQENKISYNPPKK